MAPALACPQLRTWGIFFIIRTLFTPIYPFFSPPFTPFTLLLHLFIPVTHLYPHFPLLFTPSYLYLDTQYEGLYGWSSQLLLSFIPFWKFTKVLWNIWSTLLLLLSWEGNFCFCFIYVFFRGYFRLIFFQERIFCLFFFRWFNISREGYNLIPFFFGFLNLWFLQEKMILFWFDFLRRGASFDSIFFLCFSTSLIHILKRRYVDDLVFPAISICNVNDMKLSVMNGTQVHLFL